MQCKAQRCYESQSKQLKNEGEKIFPRYARTDGHYPRCLRQWPYHSKNASYGPVIEVLGSLALIILPSSVWHHSGYLTASGCKVSATHSKWTLIFNCPCFVGWLSMSHGTLVTVEWTSPTPLVGHYYWTTVYDCSKWHCWPMYHIVQLRVCLTVTNFEPPAAFWLLSMQFALLRC